MTIPLPERQRAAAERAASHARVTDAFLDADPERRKHLQNDDHRLVLTGVGSCPDIMQVRCTCRAEYRGVSRSYFNYDPLGQALTLREATDLWKRHLADPSADGLGVWYARVGERLTGAQARARGQIG